MTAEWWILLAGQVITVLGLGGVLVWMGRTIKAMKGTVDAQAETIKAQAEKMSSMETLLKAMDTVLKSTDETKMLERLEAYKRFVDHEREADTKKLTAAFEREKANLESGSKLFAEASQALIGSLLDFGTSTLPYVPKAQRREFIERIDAPGAGPVLRKVLHRYAEQAPDLSDRGLSFALRALQDVRDEASRETPLTLRLSKEPEPPIAPEP
jgi:hypothetical protein